MAKYVIDIPEDHKRVIDNLVEDGKGYLLPSEVENRMALEIRNATPLERVLEDIKSEIEEKFGGLTICEWEENYDFEENDISEYVYVSEVKEILEIIDKHIGKENVW